MHSVEFHSIHATVPDNGEDYAMPRVCVYVCACVYCVLEQDNNQNVVNHGRISMKLSGSSLRQG